MWNGMASEIEIEAIPPTNRMASKLGTLNANANRKIPSAKNTKAMMNREMEDHAVVVEVFVDAEVFAMVEDLGAVVDAVVSVAPDRTMKMAKRRMVSKEMALLGEVAEDAVVVEAEDLAVVVADVAVETKMAGMTNESFETKKILFTYLTPTFVLC